VHIALAEIFLHRDKCRDTTSRRQRMDVAHGRGRRCLTNQSFNSELRNVFIYVKVGTAVKEILASAFEQCWLLVIPIEFSE
jgi:hypothetical protein